MYLAVYVDDQPPGKSEEDLMEKLRNPIAGVLVRAPIGGSKKRKTGRPKKVKRKVRGNKKKGGDIRAQKAALKI